MYTTTVVRNAPRGKVHGGLYKDSELVLSWNDADFDFEGRGGDRGLRGLVTYENRLYVAAADRILILENHKIIDTIRHPCLRLLHEMCRTETGFWVVSTGYDAVLHYDFEKGFTEGLHFGDQVVSTLSPPKGNRWHLNSVSTFRNKLLISGLRTHNFPTGTHSTRMDEHGFIFCDTDRNCLNVYGTEYAAHFTPQCGYGARSGFLRGLARNNDVLYVGTSPAAVQEFNLTTREWGQKTVLSNDFRVAVQSIIV